MLPLVHVLPVGKGLLLACALVSIPPWFSVALCPFFSITDLAPEMFRECHERGADIYSLGLCIWEGLKGSHPIPTSDPQVQQQDRLIEFAFEPFFSIEARDLIRKVCMHQGSEGWCILRCCAPASGPHTMLLLVWL